MATARDRGRCRERLDRLSESSLDCESLQREAIVDPAGRDRVRPLVLELEYSGGDFATMTALARRANAVGRLSAETGGDLARSPRWEATDGRWVKIEAARRQRQPDAQIALTLRAATATVGVHEDRRPQPPRAPRPLQRWARPSVSAPGMTAAARAASRHG